MSDAVSTRASSQVTLREAAPEDAGACARILFEAFGAIHDQHRFPRDFPTPEAATAMMGTWIPHPSVWGVVAERDGRVVGSNFLDERNPIRGVGPITVAPDGQSSGVGRKLMEAVIERGGDAPGIRLLQDSFNMSSLSLYRSLGFLVKEPVAMASGQPRSRPPDGVEVRSLRAEDLGGCEALCERVHGFARTKEVEDALRALACFVALRDGRVTAYATSVSFWAANHGVAETEEDMKALLLGAAASMDEPLGLLIPLRSGLLGWCLDEGLRLVKPMNLMALGEYQGPRGSWFPSVLY